MSKFPKIELEKEEYYLFLLELNKSSDKSTVKKDIKNIFQLSELIAVEMCGRFDIGVITKGRVVKALTSGNPFQNIGKLIGTKRILNYYVIPLDNIRYGKATLNIKKQGRFFGVCFLKPIGLPDDHDLPTRIDLNPIKKIVNIGTKIDVIKGIFLTHAPGYRILLILNAPTFLEITKGILKIRARLSRNPLIQESVTYLGEDLFSKKGLSIQDGKVIYRVLVKFSNSLSTKDMREWTKSIEKNLKKKFRIQGIKSSLYWGWWDLVLTIEDNLTPGGIAEIIRYMHGNNNLMTSISIPQTIL